MMRWFRTKRKTTDEREAWLSALRVFDANHQKVRAELEAALAEEEGRQNGNGNRR